MLEKQVENYIASLNKSENTCESYRRALRQMCEFLYVKSKSDSKTKSLFAEEIITKSSEKKHLQSMPNRKEKFAKATLPNREEKLAEVISDFVDELRTLKSPATVVQVISILRGFFDYEISLGQMQTNPLNDIEPPKLEKKPKREFTFSQIPQGYAAKAVRDRAMITILEETGMKVSELLRLKVSDIEFGEDGQVEICISKGNQLSITQENPKVKEKKKVDTYTLGKEISDIVYDYIYATREEILNGATGSTKTGNEATVTTTGSTKSTAAKNTAPTDLLFTNMDGRAMSRQGFWKNMHAYGCEGVQPAQNVQHKEI